MAKGGNGTPDDIVIPVMGPTGVGKSTFINGVAGREVMTVGYEIESCTADIQAAEIDTAHLLKDFPFLRKRRLLLVDTPGFDDTYVGDLEILERIAKWLEERYRTRTALGGVIYLHNISDNRFTGTARKNLAMLNRLCGDVAVQKVVLGTTMACRLRPMEAEKRLARLKEVHWKDMVDKGAQVFQMHEGGSSPLALVTALLRRFKTQETTVLDIQRELVDKKMDIPETKAGKELRSPIPPVLEHQKRYGSSTRKVDAGDTAAAAELLDLPDDAIVIPVMGPAGVGKSTFINGVVGREVMTVDDEVESCTLQAAEINTAHLLKDFPFLRKQRLFLVETPGFDDTYVGNSEILERIAKWLGARYRTRTALGGVVYLHDISNERFTGTAGTNLVMFNRLCGDVAIKKVVLGATMACRLPPKEAAKRLARLKEVHWKDMVDKGAQVFQINEGGSSPLDLVIALLRRFKTQERTVLDIQHELVDKKMLIPETKAGKELRDTIQQVLEHRKQYASLARKVDKGDTAAAAELLETKQQIEQLTEELRKLKVPLSRRILRLFRFY